ncbi:uncharacterized protein [Montipora capricornis]|uniref:uncharacterized protein n=1 Tax=Montipora capricornis TaxID=246305 RepID=UPI0035F13EB3
MAKELLLVSQTSTVTQIFFSDLIEDPLAEEQTRRQKARGLWTQKKTSKLCATLAKTNYQFGQTSEKMKMQCQSCNTQREKKKRRKEASNRAANAAEARAAAAVAAAAAAIKPQQPLPCLAREPSEEEEEIDIENGDPPPRERWVDPDVLAAIAASTPLSLADSDADDTKVDVESQQVEMKILDDESATTPVLQELKKDSMHSTTCETPGLNILAEVAAFAVRLPLTESCKDRIELGTGSTKQPQFEKNNLDGASLRAHHKLKRGNMPCDSCDTSRLNILAAVAASSSPLPTTKSVEDEGWSWRWICKRV